MLKKASSLKLYIPSLSSNHDYSNQIHRP
uniref:Uncharacterized protein n=1 Tax=Anguilla anguilla TaxID=7936 RepID=A0A0E9WT69_ANGAN